MRHPVIANVFENEPMMMSPLFEFGTLAIEYGFASP